MELYRKHRPEKLSEVVGQDDAIRAITKMGKQGELPHALLFTGPSGTGKTTIARILKRILKCDDIDFIELNCASDARGIQTVRNIAESINSAPLSKCRIWLLDEVHQLTGDAQNGMLKILEDVPDHVYFFLATTDPAKLKKTIHTRCTEIKCKSLDIPTLKQLVEATAAKEGKVIDDSVSTKIARTSEGSARKALVLLHSVIDLDDIKQQTSVIEQQNVSANGIEVARALLKGSNWKSLSSILGRIENDEAETVRRIVMSYMEKVLLGGGNNAHRAAAILEEFTEPFYNSGRPGLTVACWITCENK